MESLLIDHHGGALVIVLSFVLILEIVIAIGYVSGNLENAITFTILAMAPLFFLFTLFH
jgi:type IV secretory pathway VirB6-like protein